MHNTAIENADNSFFYVRCLTFQTSLPEVGKISNTNPFHSQGFKNHRLFIPPPFPPSNPLSGHVGPRAGITGGRKGVFFVMQPSQRVPAIFTPQALPPAWPGCVFSFTFNKQGHERDEGRIQFSRRQSVGPVVSGRILGRNKVLLVSDEGDVPHPLFNLLACVASSSHNQVFGVRCNYGSKADLNRFDWF